VHPAASSAAVKKSPNFTARIIASSFRADTYLARYAAQLWRAQADKRAKFRPFYADYGKMLRSMARVRYKQLGLVSANKR
jgi:hypothetical protein